MKSGHIQAICCSPQCHPQFGWCLLFTAKGVNNKYIPRDKDRSFQPCTKCRRHSKELMNCEMVLRHQKTQSFFLSKWCKLYKILSQDLQPYNFIKKSSECERQSTILRSSVIISMILSIPNVWIEPCQPSQNPAQSRYSCTIHVAETCISWHGT